MAIDGDDIKTKNRHGFAGELRNPTVGCPDQAQLFAKTNRGCGISKSGGPAKADLHKHHHGPIPHHQIQLPNAVTDISGQADKAPLGQKGKRLGLGGMALALFLA